MRLAAAVLAVLVVGAGAGEPERFVFEHPSPEGSETRRFEARIDRPEAGRANGHAVMLIGGGSVTDMDWTVMGSYELDGEVTRVTIDNAPTRDAKTIGDALVDAGFTVMRWSSIHQDDELAKETPGMAMGIPFVYSVGLTRAARDAFRERAPEAGERLILVGHSLGAPRATAVADEGVVGLVFLAGAYMSRTLTSPREICEDAFGEWAYIDADGDGVMTDAELGPDPRGCPTGSVVSALRTHDVDGDGDVRRWEVAAWGERPDHAAAEGSAELRPGVPWPSEVIRERAIPSLAVYGGLDPMSVHGPWLEAFAKRQGLADVSVEYWAARGHQLSREEGELCGPIDAGVVWRIADWCSGVAAAHNP